MDYGVYVENWLPILPQYVEADISVEVDVRMEDFRVTNDFGRLVRIVAWDRKIELIFCTLPVSHFWFDIDVEFCQFVRVRKFWSCDVIEVAEAANVFISSRCTNTYVSVEILIDD